MNVGGHDATQQRADAQELGEGEEKEKETVSGDVSKRENVLMERGGNEKLSRCNRDSTHLI